MTVAGNLYLFL